MKPSAPPRPGLGPGLHVGATGGTLGRQGRVRTPDGRVALFDDAFGGPGAVITRRADTLADIPADARTALEALGLSLVALSGSAGGHTVIDDVDGTYLRWLDDIAADTIVVRPDFHLYGSCTSDGTAALIDGFLTRVGARSAAAPRAG